MRKHNQVHTLGAPHYKAHFRFLRKLKDFKCLLSSEKTVVALICWQAIICLPRMQKPVSEYYVIEWFMGTIVEWCEYCAFAHHLMQSESCTS